MISITIIIFILFLHFFADFVLQKHEDAIKKSTSIRHLFAHVWGYSLFVTFVMCILAFFAGGVALLNGALLFGVITFICHFITDYFTSKLNSILWKSGNMHDFFVSIGFDQWLHTVQLILTYILIFG